MNSIKTGSPQKQAGRGQKKPASTFELCADALQPLIDWCQQERGRVADVCRRFNEGQREPVRRSTLDRWLNPVKKDRIEPLFGAGIRLLQVWRQISETDPEFKAPVPELEGTHPVVIYFRDAQDRYDFCQAVAKEKPNWTAKAL